MKRLLAGLLLLLGAGAVEAADCLVCHAGVEASLEGTPHAALSAGEAAGEACEQCHGDGAAHVQNPSGGNLMTFTDERALAQGEACGSCHADVHAGGRGIHAQAEVPCSGCHSVHGSREEKTSLPFGFSGLKEGSATCAGCHEDILAQFAFSERHRLAENAVTCSDCHDPHETRRGPVLHGAGASVCTDCHTEVEGPFLFEHAASQVDGCLSCHTPHGGTNRHLLTHQDVGELCYGCHATVPQFHLGFVPSAPPRFGRDSVCTNCHVTIHGSNLDRFFLK